MCKKTHSLKELLGNTFGSGREKPGLGDDGLSWLPALLWVSKPWLVGSSWEHWGHRTAPAEPELRTLPTGAAGAGHSQASLTTSFSPLLSLPEFQELCWNTKPRCQRHLASAVFHHKTLRHENFLPCDSSGCLLPGVPAMPWPCWKSCQGGLWSHL